MELKQLESFVTIMRKNSFSAAAEVLLITQPTISTQISSLEHELDVKLFIRKSKSIEPTREGRILYKYAVEIISRRDAALQALKDVKNPSVGTITIGASTTPARHYLPPLIAEFQKKQKGAFFRISNSDSVTVVQNIIDQKIEIGMTGILVPSPYCESKCMAVDRWIVILPNNLRYRNLIISGFLPEMILKERFICRNLGSGWRKDVDHFLSQLGLDPSALRVVSETNDTETIIHMVSNGVGISVISQRVAERYVRSGDILPVSFDHLVPSRPLYLVRSKNTHLSAFAQKFWDFASDYYQH